MTHTDVSEQSQLILDSFVNQSLVESVITCIGAIYHKDNEDKTTSIMEYLKTQNLQSSPAHYLKESTTGVSAGKRLKLQLQNGWRTGGGFRLPLTEPPKWNEYQNHSRNVRYKIHSWVMLDSLLVEDSITKSEEYLNLAVDIADDWINNFVILAQKDDFAWYDMAVGQRATKLAYMLRRLIEIDAPSDKIFRFVMASELHFSELMEKERIAIHSNHGLFQVAGLLSLCHNLPWMKKSSGGIKFSEEIFEKMLNEHFAEDGLHLEHSPDYHLYMVNYLQLLRDSGWVSKNINQTSKIIDLAVETANWLAMPNNDVIPIGDTANNIAITHRWAGYKGEINIGHRFFPTGGLFINNSITQNTKNQLVFSAQFHSRQHKHADNLNVLYTYNNQPLLVDPGTFTYQYDVPERMYCESTRSHNVVEIDGLNYSRFRQDAFGSAISLVAKAEDCIIVEGKVNYNRLISSFIPNNKIKSPDGVPVDITHRRIIVERPGHFLAIIDHLDSSEVHRYIPWYHLHPDLTVKKDTATRLAVYGEKNQKICKIQCYNSNSESIASLEVKGQTEPNLQGWYSINGRELVENIAIGFPIIDNSKFIVTVFDFDMQKTGKPYLRIGTGGKYLRFALTQNSEKIDVKFKSNKDSTRNIEVEIDNLPIEVNIEFGEG